MTTVLTPDEARAFLVSHHGLARRTLPRGAAGVRALLEGRRCIQLDPLDPWGTNADLVAFARIDGLRRGDVHRHLHPGRGKPGFAFEHFAKERCLLPARAFPQYREQAAETPWWRLGERVRRVPAHVLDAVLAEVRERGPLTADAMTDHGAVEPLNWDGWVGTKRLASMALEILWTRCQVVVAGRDRRGQRIYDVPERALGEASAEPSSGPFERWALLERIEAAGLLTRAAGPLWSMLSSTRTSSLPDALVAEGLAEDVRVEGAPRRYLAPKGFADRPRAKPDDRMRLLAPLDPLLWDRALVLNAFGFEYAWEVYKPASERRFGWYVCPLLHRGRLVGRIEGAVKGTTLVVTNIWREANTTLDEDALGAMLERHAESCGADLVKRPKRVRVAG